MPPKEQTQQPQADNLSDEHDLEIASLDGNRDDAYEYELPSDAPGGYVQINTNKDGHVPAPDQDGDTLITLGTNADVIRQEVSAITSDEETIEDFTERQGLADNDVLLERLREHNMQSPVLSGQDIDADWDSADQSGEETVGGTVATPGQDVVSELGEAVGIIYADTEPLDTLGKLQARDEQRWELNPASAEDAEDEEVEDEGGDWDDDFLLGGVDVEEGEI